ncbi:MAG: EAL domain-containing protein [Acidimicrobiales bacterium]
MDQVDSSAGMSRWDRIAALYAHPVIIDALRTARAVAGAAVEIVAFDAGRAIVVGSDVAEALVPRPPRAAEAALLADGATVPGTAVVVDDATAVAVFDADGELFGAISIAAAIEPDDQSVLAGVARMFGHLLGERAAGTTTGGLAEGVLDGLRDAIVVLDENFEVTWCNASIAMQLAINQTDVIGRSIADFVHPDDLALAMDAAIRSQSGHTTLQLELRLRHGRGDWEPMEIRGLDRSTDPRVGGLVVAMRSEHRRGHIERELDRNRRVSAAIIEDLTDAVIAIDPTGGVRVINSAARALFGIDPATPTAAITLEHLVLFDRRGRRLPPESHPLDIGDTALTGPAECCVANDAGVRSVVLQARRVRHSDGDDLGVVVTIQDVTEAIATSAELEASALVDQLTGLSNRRHLDQRLDELLADGVERRIGVCFIDLDGFKAVNDLHGHRVGDELLRLAASRLRSRLRDGDVLARQGGDEFVAVLVDLIDDHHAESIAERLRAVLAEPFEIDGTVFHVTASAGIAVARIPGVSGEVLLQRADLALYAAKEAGRNCIELFDDELAAASEAEQRTREMIRTAISDDALVMHFQPMIDSDAGAVVGFEALVRCRSADGTIIGPGAFLGELDGSHLLVDLDLLAFRLSCAAALELIAVQPSVRVAANLSAATLRQRDTVELLLATAAEVGVSPRSMTIEVTESSAFVGGGLSARTLWSLHEAGFAIALDDFGTGYSSLAHLRDLPLSVVKLDRSFVPKLHRQSTERAIASAIVRLSDELGFATVAEGVENAGQLVAVRSLGYRVVQGWHYAPALPFDDAVGLLRQGSIDAGGPLHGVA